MLNSSSGERYTIRNESILARVLVSGRICLQQLRTLCNYNINGIFKIKNLIASKRQMKTLNSNVTKTEKAWDNSQHLLSNPYKYDESR